MKMSLRIPDGKFHFHIRARQPMAARPTGSIYAGPLPISVIAQGAAVQAPVTPPQGTGAFGRRRGTHAFYARGVFPLPAPFPTLANPFPACGPPPSAGGKGPRVLVQAHRRQHLTSGFGVTRRGLGQVPVGPQYVDPSSIPGYLVPGTAQTLESPEPGLVAPTITEPAGGGTLVLSAPPSSSAPVSTNSALDLQNQQLTNQLASLTPSQLQAFVTSPTAQAQALSTGLIPSSITSWFSGSTTIGGTSVSNTTIALVVAVFAVFALSRNKKGKR